MYLIKLSNNVFYTRISTPAILQTSLGYPREIRQQFCSNLPHVEDSQSKCTSISIETRALSAIAKTKATKNSCSPVRFLLRKR